MSEVQVSYETRAWRYACDVCKEGDMISMGNQLLPTSPPMYPSQCTNCGFVCNLLHKYPKVETVIGDIDYTVLVEPTFAGLTLNEHEELMERSTPKRGAGRVTRPKGDIDLPE